jgi:hypothetical protein
MKETLNVELTERERDVLLRGLRFVRSCISMNPCDPTPEVRLQRTTELQQVEALVSRLNNAPSASTSSL